MAVKNVHRDSILAHTRKLVDDGATPSDLVGYYLGVAVGVAASIPDNTLDRVLDGVREIWADVEHARSVGVIPK